MRRMVVSALVIMALNGWGLPQVKEVKAAEPVPGPGTPLPTPTDPVPKPPTPSPGPTDPTTPPPPPLPPQPKP